MFCTARGVWIAQTRTLQHTDLVSIDVTKVISMSRCCSCLRAVCNVHHSGANVGIRSSVVEHEAVVAPGDREARLDEDDVGRERPWWRGVIPHLP